MPLQTVVDRLLYVEPITIVETYNLYDSNLQRLQVLQQLSLSKAMKTQQVLLSYYLHLRQGWNHLLTALHSQFRFCAMFFMHHLLMTYSCFSSVMQVLSTSLRCKLAGSNDITRQRRGRRHARTNKLWRTVSTTRRVRPKINRPFITNKWCTYNVYNKRAICRYTTLCIPQWLVSRTTRWFRNYSKYFNNFHYLHDAVAGRLTHGGVFATNQN